MGDPAGRHREYKQFEELLAKNFYENHKQPLGWHWWALPVIEKDRWLETAREALNEMAGVDFDSVIHLDEQMTELRAELSEAYDDLHELQRQRHEARQP